MFELVKIKINYWAYLLFNLYIYKTIKVQSIFRLKNALII